MKRIDLQKMFHGKHFIEHLKNVSRETFAHKMEVFKIKKGFGNMIGGLLKFV